MSVLHVIYRISVIKPSGIELSETINHLYPNNPAQFYQILTRNLDSLLTNIPGSPLPVISSGVIIQNDITEAHIWAEKKDGKIITEEITNLLRSFVIEPKFEFPAIKCGNTHRYQIQFQFSFELSNGYIAIEYPLQFGSI